jgi:hypothetical protein
MVSLQVFSLALFIFISLWDGTSGVTEYWSQREMKRARARDLCSSRLLNPPLTLFACARILSLYDR